MVQKNRAIDAKHTLIDRKHEVIEANICPIVVYDRTRIELVAGIKEIVMPPD